MVVLSWPVGAGSPSRRGDEDEAGRIGVVVPDARRQDLQPVQLRCVPGTDGDHGRLLSLRHSPRSLGSRGDL